MQIEEGLRDTKSMHYGLDFANEIRVEAKRRANLLLIAALIILALWLTGICLIRYGYRTTYQSQQQPGSLTVFGYISRQNRLRYVAFELSVSMLEQAQALLLGFFDSFEGG